MGHEQNSAKTFDSYLLHTTVKLSITIIDNCIINVVIE